MHSINVNVISKKSDGKIPVEVAGSVMIDIQSLFRHIGEYTISKELRLQNRIDRRLSEMFDLFIDPSSGISLRSVPSISTSGIVDDALMLLERTLISMGSGAGGYWIEDNFQDPRFRRLIAEDIIQLAEDLSAGEGYYMKFAADSVFDKVDSDKIGDFIIKLGMSYENATCGVIRATHSKSKRVDGVKLEIAGNRVRMTFTDKSIEDQAMGLIGKASIVGGRIKFVNGSISDIGNVMTVVPFNEVKFNRMISSEGDVKLTETLTAKVEFNEAKEEWILTNEGLGINISKKDWDSAITTFHDYFIFLWNEYAIKEGGELSEEEQEVKDYLLKLVVV